MADPTPVTLQLKRDIGTVPPPDDLIAGSKGAVYVDLVKISTAGDYKRGTLMMASADGYVNATQAGLATAGGICILAEDINIGSRASEEVKNIPETFTPVRRADYGHKRLLRAENGIGSN